MEILNDILAIIILILYCLIASIIMLKIFEKIIEKIGSDKPIKILIVMSITIFVLIWVAIGLIFLAGLDKYISMM